MFKGAVVGAIGGAVGAGARNFATNILGNAFVGGIVGGAAGGAASGYAGAAMFGGHRGIAMEQGALWGGISGGVSQGMTMAGIPDAFAQAGSGYLSGHWESGDKAGRTGAAYAAVGQLMGNILTMSGLDSDGVVPEQDSPEWQKFVTSNDTYVTTPNISFKGLDNLWMAVAFLTNGRSHTWHSMDSQYVPSGHHYKRVRNNVSYPGDAESYLSKHANNGTKNFNLINNNCTTRFGAPNPSAYYSRNNYSGHSDYWRYQR